MTEPDWDKFPDVHGRGASALTPAQAEMAKAIDRINAGDFDVVEIDEGDTLAAQQAKPVVVTADRLSDMLAVARGAGWAVAVHNDYRRDSQHHTFWLFTREGHCVKGEGLSDEIALREALAAAGLLGEETT